MPQSMDAAVAIQHAIDCLKAHAGDNDAIERLQEILDQKGCEHFDGDGSLTNLIDIIIDG
jgi:hypothetical protein